MSSQQQQSGPGGHYSGTNRIPNIKEFVERLDRDKSERDRRIDEQRKAALQAGDRGDAVPHIPTHAGVEGTKKTVTDPTTGRQVMIEDVNKDMVKNSQNPMLSVPNANLGKPT
ncbi:hypothetical protein LTR28_010948, partial [Elasticomyces elasticus]